MTMYNFVDELDIVEDYFLTKHGDKPPRNNNMMRSNWFEQFERWCRLYFGLIITFNTGQIPGAATHVWFATAIVDEEKATMFRLGVSNIV